MKAVVIHEYGGPEVLKFEDVPNPTVGAGEVLVWVSATSFNPFDMMRGSGAAKDIAPIRFPGIVGVDLSGTIIVEQARSLGVHQVIATDDDNAIADLPPLDAVADTVNGQTAEKLLTKIKPNGVFATVLGAPQSAKDYPNIKAVPVYAQPDTKILLAMAQAVKRGKLVIPLNQKVPLRDAAKVHAGAGKGSGKVLLVPGQN
jgi:NADPH:quinone reductase-like Zn-dependent oxidoreductase